MPRRSDGPSDDELDRNFDDLLQEQRVSQNGTQILFAFLLTVPFSNGFSKVTAFQQGFYFAALLLAALSAAMLIAPAVMHRVLFREQQKPELLANAARVALGGQVLLVLAVGSSVFLVGDYLYGVGAGVASGLFVVAWTTTWFFALPLWLRSRGSQT